MSAVTERATRRQLRRAMGESGVTVINSHADSIADILKALERFNARLTEAETREKVHGEAAKRVLTRPLAGRFRWLLTGR